MKALLGIRGPLRASGLIDASRNIGRYQCISNSLLGCRSGEDHTDYLTGPGEIGPSRISLANIGAQLIDAPFDQFAPINVPADGIELIQRGCCGCGEPSSSGVSENRGPRTALHGSEIGRAHV